MRQELITQKSVPDRYNPFFQHQSFEIKGKKQQQNFCNILSQNFGKKSTILALIVIFLLFDY